MLNKQAMPRSLGGGYLPGANIVRIIYADEAGRGSIKEEPYFVVACAITQPDTQWHEIRRHYADLANDIFGFVKTQDKYVDYIFHAEDIWHGTKDFHRSRFTRDERMKILTRLSQVPKLYDVPICLGVLDRTAFSTRISGSSLKPKTINMMEYGEAYAKAIQFVDTWMGDHCPEEVAMVTVEDSDKLKAGVRWYHDGAQKRDEHDDYYDRGTFVTKNIVDTVNFASKRDSPVLQIADHCAFLAKRKVAGCKHTSQIWKNIWPMVCTKNKHASSTIVLWLKD